MIDVKNIALLITGCIKPSQEVYMLAISDENVRFSQYIESLKWFIDYSDFEKIVFCDNSNFPIEYSILQYARSRGKQLEWLSFQGNNDVVERYGKGYGEGEIIEYALKNSKILNEVSYFCKVTGRLRIDNINQFLKNAEITETYFFTDSINIGKKISKVIETRFYGIPKDIYCKYYKDAYKETNDKEGYYLEHAFYTKFCLTEKKSASIMFYPRILGLSGSQGLRYQSSIFKIFLKTMVSAIGCYAPKIE